LKARLEDACADLDHTELAGDLVTGEGLVTAIARRLPDAQQIDAERSAEGIFARLTRTVQP
jgi:hypothetical protein